MSDARGTTRISELDNLESGNEAFNTLLLEASKLSPLSETTLYQSRKVSLPRIGGYLANEQLHENLLTQNKTIVGAINELKLNSGGLDLRDGAGHNSIFRGKYLGVAPNADQYEAIDNGKFSYTNPVTGNFEDIYVGDYWQSDGPNGTDTVWRVACLDYYYNISYDMQTHHAVIVPDTSIIQNVRYNLPLNDEGEEKGSFLGVSNESYLVNNCRTYTAEFTSKYHTGAANYEFDNGYWFVFQRSTVNGPSAALIKDVKINGDLYEHKFKNKGTHVELDRNNPAPAGSTVTITYKYYSDEIPTQNEPQNLLNAKAIIENYFGANHLLPLKISMYTTIEPDWYQAPPSLYPHTEAYSMYYTKNVYNYTVFLPTVQSFLGNIGNASTDFYFNNWLINEAFEQDFDNIAIDQSYFDSHQFPLFQYNPNLICSRESYWFRDTYYKMSDMENDLLIVNPKSKNYAVMYSDGMLGCSKDQYTSNIRPVFCLYKGSQEA